MIARMALAALLLFLLGRFVPMNIRDQYGLHGLNFYATVLLAVLVVEAIYRIWRRNRAEKRMRPQIIHIHHNDGGDSYGDDGSYTAGVAPEQAGAKKRRRRSNSPQGPR